MKSIWYENEDSIPQFSSLKGETKTDVLIIGGGMAGLLTAFFLHKAGVKYLLLEKDRIFRGISGNTTAKITFQHGLIYQKLLKDEGQEKAQLYLEANRSAAETFADLCRSIDCDYKTADNFVYTTSDKRKLEREINALNKIGYNADLCENLPLPIKTAGAVRFKEQAEFNPMKFASAVAKGLNICENTRVIAYEPNKVITEKGKITAKRIIVCTHFPFINNHGAFFLKLYQHRSYVLALKDAAEYDGMYVDEDKNGYSFRNYNGLLLLGGGGHKTGKRGGSYRELEEFAKKHYKNSRQVASWAAQDCMSLDNICYIGRYSKKTPELYTASGFNKWGMTSSMVAARILSDEMQGIRNEFSAVFSPDRSILKPQLFVNGVSSMEGMLSLSTKRCPHLGCALKWNKAEHSWDCPCHGSRFSKEGKLLDNPANCDIKNLDN